MFVTPFIPLTLRGIFKEGTTMLRIPLLRIRGERGVMKKRVLILIGDIKGESPNFKMELVEKLNYYNLERSEVVLCARL